MSLERRDFNTGGIYIGREREKRILLMIDFTSCEVDKFRAYGGANRR